MKNYLIYPTKKMYISQSYTGNYSHNKSSNGNPKDYPIDESCGGSGRDYFYCPCDEVVIKRIYGVGVSGTNTIWMESTKPVILANNKESFVTIMVTHPNDDTLKNIKIGDKFKRGQKMFLEGNDGNATGNHFHISVSASKYVSGGWQENNLGAWVIKGNPIKPEDAFYIDEDFTEVLNTKGIKFKNFVKNIGNPTSRNEDVKQIEVLVDNLRIRSKPNGEILGYANKGIYNVLNVLQDNNYIWYEIDENMWIASNEGDWTIFYDMKIENEIIDEELIEEDKNDVDVIFEKESEENVNIFVRIFRFIINLFKK